jgi:hypothetical protein
MEEKDCICCKENTFVFSDSERCVSCTEKIPFGVFDFRRNCFLLTFLGADYKFPIKEYHREEDFELLLDIANLTADVLTEKEVIKVEIEQTYL